jgi:exodeoxyribonuclease-1
MQTFLFYDIETSGLNPAFDQVLTFAAIRTDLSLNEIDRRSITIRLRDDIVPSPGAFLTHGLAYDTLLKGICEYDAARQIHALVNMPGTTSVGYNSLGFDDEFLRFLFYRNLLDPYTHQYANGCSRMDALPIAVIYRVFHPNGLNWPMIEGKPSLKLEWLSRENQFETSGPAHDAISDVEALLALSKIFFKNQDIWSYCLDFFNKTRDEVRIKGIDTNINISSKTYPFCLMASAAVGPDANYLSPVIPIGSSRSYKNQSLWLRMDTQDILGLDKERKLEETYVVRKRYGDLPVMLPMLDRFERKLPEQSKEQVKKNMTVIEKNESYFNSFVDYHCAFKYPFVPDIDIDADLYQAGFFTADEKKQAQQFHLSSIAEKSTFLSQIPSGRVKQLASRIVIRNFKDSAETIEDACYDQHVKNLGLHENSGSVTGYKEEAKFTSYQAIQEIEQLKKDQTDLSSDQMKMLEWLEGYIKKHF